jgi:hypothetical protein
MDLDSVAPTLQAGVALVGAQRGALVPGRGSREEDVSFTAPTWARELVVDATMPPSSWARFTDFAATIYDQSGRIIAKEPMNYSDVRLRVELPEGLTGQMLTLRLTPAFADSADTGVWTLGIRLRLYAEAPVPLDVAAGEDTRTVHMTSGARATIRFHMPASPWPLPDGFFPLGEAVVMSEDFRWTREAGLPTPIGPVMR